MMGRCYHPRHRLVPALEGRTALTEPGE